MARASFVTLPLELKVKVVEMASDQEDAWRERSKVDEDAGHINSLSSLALVSKGLRDLAAKYQFMVVHSTKTHQPVFRFAIYPYYGDRITEVVFKDTPGREGTESAALLLSDLAHLPAVRSLSFDRDAAVALFGPGVTLAPDLRADNGTTFYRIKALTDISPKIDTLTLLDRFKPSEAVSLVRTFKNVRTLTITDMESGTVEQIAALTGAISSLRNLESLTLGFNMDSDHGWPIEALAPLERDPPPIKRLQLLGFDYRRSLIELIRPFSSTIETLSLIPTSELSELALLPPPTPLLLPRLVNLYLQLDVMSTLDTIRPLFLSVSSLQHLSITSIEELPEDRVDPKDPSLLALLSSQPTLRRLCFEEGLPEYVQGTEHHATPASLAAFADLIHSRDLAPADLDRPHLTPFQQYAELDYSDNEAKYLKEILGRTLAFGQTELERMFADGNVAKAAGWVAKLKALEEERLSWKD